METQEKTLQHQWIEAGLEDSLAHMSNFDNAIDPECEANLRTGKFYCQHAAWDFCGYVRWDEAEQTFVEEVWRYNAPVAVLKDPDLRDLMDKVNDRFGWD